MSKSYGTGSEVTSDDALAVSEDLGRRVRGLAEVGARCVCGRPLVAVTAPRLPNGTPFPTTFYLSAPPLVVACSRLESSGYMNGLAKQLEEDPQLKEGHATAHEDYLARRETLRRNLELDEVPEIEGITAGGLPNRVKCLHALVGHSLVAGRGVNPVGDIALEEIAERGWWNDTQCFCTGESVEAQEPTRS